MNKGIKTYFWDHIYTVKFSFLVWMPGFPTVLVPKGYKDDGHTFIPDLHEPKSTGLPPAVIAHPHDWVYQHRILADGTRVMPYEKGMCDQLYADMWQASNVWLKRDMTGTVLRGLRWFAGPTWDRRVEGDPLRPEWKPLFGMSKSAIDARMRMPIVTVAPISKRLVMLPPCVTT